MSEISLSELTLDNIGIWPKPAKIGSLILIAVLIIGAGYYFCFKNQFETLQASKDKEFNLRQTLEKKQQQAANLPLYKAQLAVMQERFGVLLRKLPSKTEIPGLLEDISDTGIRSGLQFQLFDPLQEIEHDFYVELPIEIEVVGTYHQLAVFISRVAALSRIVTLHNFTIKFKRTNAMNKTAQSKKGDKMLVMSVTANIYRYQGLGN